MGVMGRIAVFDSGLGSLSIIQAIRKVTKADIIYFADQKHYPYGKKSNDELRKIITDTIQLLKEKFSPDAIVIGSNTPTLLFPDLISTGKATVGVLPPLAEAQKKTKTNSIAILATTATINDTHTDIYIQNNLSNYISVTKIDGTKLIDLVESGKFISNKKFCEKIINEILSTILKEKKIDVVTLSSTHLPFLLSILQKLFPKIVFLDPAMQVATGLIKNKLFSPSKRNTLTIFTSGDTKTLEANLKKLKIKNKVHSLDF